MAEAKLHILPRLESEIDEADRLLELPHPAEMLDLVGHQEAETVLLDAFRSQRMHHGWILGGQEGIGKATLAYRLARFLLAHPDPLSGEVVTATSMDVPESVRAARIIAAQAHPDLFMLRRGWNEKTKKLRTEIQVDDVRELVHMFHSTSSAGGWRIAIVDAAEDLNNSSANALLKILEEPPPRSLFLIISHEPGRLLPTIRSRCRMLPMRPLKPDDIMRLVSGLVEEPVESDVLQKVAERAGGSVRRAFALLDGNALGFRTRVDTLLQMLPNIDQKALISVAEDTTKRDGITFERFIEAIQDYLHDVVLQRQSMGAAALILFADVAERLSRAQREVDAYNLDRRPLVLATFNDLANAVRQSG